MDAKHQVSAISGLALGLILGFVVGYLTHSYFYQQEWYWFHPINWIDSLWGEQSPC